MRRFSILLVLLAAISGCAMSGCAANPLQPAAPATKLSSPSAPAMITMINVVGQNADVAVDKLKKLGFTNIDLGTVDGRAFVALPQNWTVKRQSAQPGESLRSDAKIVLGCARNS